MSQRQRDEKSLRAEECNLEKQLQGLANPKHTVTSLVANLRARLAQLTDMECDEPLDVLKKAVIADIAFALSWLAEDVVSSFIHSAHGRRCRPRIQKCDALGTAYISLHCGLSRLALKLPEDAPVPEQFLRNCISRDLKKMGKQESFNIYPPSSTQAGRKDGRKLPTLFKGQHLDIYAVETCIDDTIGYEAAGSDAPPLEESRTGPFQSCPGSEPTYGAHWHRSQSNPRLIAQANELRQLLPTGDREKSFIDCKVDKTMTRSEIARELGVSVSTVSRIRATLAKRAEALGYVVQPKTSSRKESTHDRKDRSRTAVRRVLPDGNKMWLPAPDEVLPKGPLGSKDSGPGHPVHLRRQSRISPFEGEVPYLDSVELSWEGQGTLAG